MHVFVISLALAIAVNINIELEVPFQLIMCVLNARSDCDVDSVFETQAPDTGTIFELGLTFSKITRSL